MKSMTILQINKGNKKLVLIPPPPSVLVILDSLKYSIPPTLCALCGQPSPSQSTEYLQTSIIFVSLLHKIRIVHLIQILGTLYQNDFFIILNETILFECSFKSPEHRSGGHCDPDVRYFYFIHKDVIIQAYTQKTVEHLFF